MTMFQRGVGVMRLMARLVARHIVLLTILISIWMIFVLADTSDDPFVGTVSGSTAPVSVAPRLLSKPG